jgi:hypothetical protein
MSAISGVSAANLPQPSGKVAGTDADGDNDGTAKAQTTAPASPAPVASKPTATIGNRVDTYA